MTKRKLNNQSNHHTSKFSHLPEEIFQEILSRLPVKALMQFKCVSKSWKTLIIDPRFSKLHLKQSTNHNRTSFLFLKDFQCSSIELLASCNGLFCINNAKGDLFLYNPSTKASKKIPGSPVEFPLDNFLSCVSFFCGLGYHSPSDDYKLVRVSMFYGIDFKNKVKVYSRNNDTWRRIKDFPYDFPREAPGLFVCGCLHWITCQRINTVRCNIIAALDLSDENYRLIKLPEFEHGDSYFEICSLEDNLAFFRFSKEHEVDIWIMKEYGKIETWTRIKVIIPCLGTIEAFVNFQALCVWKPGEILLRIGYKKFVVYDVKKRIVVGDVVVPHMVMESKIVSFVESLESPNAQKNV